MRTNKKRVIAAFLASSSLALIIGLLSNVAASTLRVENPWIVWGMLVIAFLISLPITLYLFLHEPNQIGGNTKAKSASSLQESVLPPKRYVRFFGRDTALDEIMNSLRERDRRLIIGIDGMGGIGKTALAREVAERCLNEKLFDVIIWEPGSSDISISTAAPLTWSSLVIALGRQLGAPDIQHLADDEREARLTSSLQSQRVLLVLDNLERATTDQDDLARHLLPLLSSGKAIMTSRRRFKGDVYSVHLRGLDEESAAQMLRYEANEKGVKRVADAQSADLRKIAQTTGGSPLALKLIVGQLEHLPMDIVLDALQNVQIEHESTDESDYVYFYKSIFWKSWQLLSEVAQQLLISMAVFAPGIGGTLDAIQSISGLDEKSLPKVIGEAWRLSFVEVSGSSLRQTRYYLHPLTLYFVVSEIVQSS